MEKTATMLVGSNNEGINCERFVMRETDDRKGERLLSGVLSRLSLCRDADTDGDLTVDLIHCYDDVDRSLCLTCFGTDNPVSPFDFLSFLVLPSAALCLLWGMLHPAKK